jgi:prepilin-type N-terminal cleavage/methylation domain-containing protein
MRKGFTLVELLITFVIIAVLAAVAIPSFANTRNKQYANQAITYLRAVRLAEKMYYAKNSPATYVACADAAAIKTTLGVEITAENYRFDVTAATPTTGFIARARQGSTAPTNCTSTETICLDQNGDWTGGSPYKPSV